MEGIESVRGKDAPWVTEDVNLVMAELVWLNGLTKTEKGLTIVVSHDDNQRQKYITEGLLGGKFE